MFFQLPSWLGYLSLDKVLSLAAYVLAFALFESLFFLAFLLLLSGLLPAKWMRTDFTVQASSLVGWIALGAYLVQRKVGILYKLEPEQLLLYAIAILVGIILSCWLFFLIYRRFPIFSHWVKSLSDRISIFNYIYLPLGAIGTLVVLLRNLF